MKKIAKTKKIRDVRRPARRRTSRVSLGKYIISLAVFVLVISGSYWLVNKNYRNPRVLGVMEMVEMKVPEWYLDPLVVSQGNNFLSITPLAGEKVRVEKINNQFIYRDAYLNTDVIQTEYQYKIKEELILKEPGHPLEFKYNLGNIENYRVEEDEQGNIIFYDKKLYEKNNNSKNLSRIFTIFTPFVQDQKHRSFKDIKAVIKENILTVTINEDWINQAIYPVLVDPTIEINLLNVQSHPQTGDNWIVEFTTKGQADLKIIPEDQATIDDDEFLSLSCDGEEKTPEILDKDIIYYPSWQCAGAGKVIHRTLRAGEHTLKFEFGDPAKPDELVTAWASDMGSEPDFSLEPYKDGTIILVKPIATGAGEGRYEAGDIIEIRPASKGLGISEKTDYLAFYYDGPISQEFINKFTASETDERETIVKRRAYGIDITKILSPIDLAKAATFRRVKKIYNLPLDSVIKKNRTQKSVTEMPKWVALASKLDKFSKSLIKTARAAATVIKIIDPDNGAGTDYVSLNAWEAQNLNLVTRDEIQIAKCRTTGGSADTTAVNITGWTTSATQYIKIWTDPAESYRHGGKWDDTKYRLILNDATPLILSVPWVYVEGLQFKRTYTSVQYSYVVQTNIYPNSAADVYLGYNISVAEGANSSFYFTGNLNLNVYAYNCVAYGGTRNGFFGYGGTQYCYNCTSTKHTGAQGYGIRGIDYVYNSIAVGNDGSDLSLATTTDYNASDDGDGTNAQVLDSTNNYENEFVDYVNDDYHLVSGSVAVNHGTNDPGSGLYSDDIDLQSRSGTWDIGADEYVTSAFCGDGSCNNSETHGTCPADCPLISNTANSAIINSPLSGRFKDSSLVGYWSFDGADMNWASSTAEALDRSGNNNNGNVTNFDKKSVTPGINGQGLKFDGNDDYVSVPHATSLNPSSAITISFWMLSHDNVSVSQLNGPITKNASTDYRIRLTANNTLTWLQAGGTIFTSTNNIFTINQWAHIALVSDSSGGIFYKNGVAWGSTGTAYISPSSSENLLFYPRSVSTNMDDVRIYNRALSPTEILEQYNAGAARMTVNTPSGSGAVGLSSGLVGSWTFDGPDMNWASTTAEALDKSGNRDGDVIGFDYKAATPGVSGQALKLDGANDYIKINNAPTLVSPYSISLWFYPTQISINQGLVAFNTSGYPFLYMYNGNRILLSSPSSGSFRTFCDKLFTASDLNKWWHLVFIVNSTTDASAWKCFLNNTDVGLTGSDSSGTYKEPTSTWTLGTYYNNSWYLPGNLDEVNIYNRQLSTDEIEKLYQLGNRKIEFSR
ncbi:MAG: LamG domain-containing protein [Patescibacteria group bacterium]